MIVVKRRRSKSIKRRKSRSIKRRRSKSIKRRRSKSIKRRKSKSIKRRRSKSIKRRKSKSIKRKSIRRKKSNDGGIIDIKGDIRNEVEFFLFHKERNLFNQIKIINSIENPTKEEIFKWLTHETDISNFFNLCYYGCFNIIKSLLDEIKDDDFKKKIVALQIAKDLTNCYFYIIEGFDRYCLNDEEVKKRYYNLLDHLLNINDEKLFSHNIMPSHLETPINICFYNCLKSHKFMFKVEPDAPLYSLNGDDFHIVSTANINRRLINHLFVKTKEKNKISELLKSTTEYINNIITKLDKDKSVSEDTLRKYFDTHVSNKDFKFLNFKNNIEKYFIDDYEYSKFLLARLNNIIKKEAEEEAEKIMKQILKEEDALKEEKKASTTPKTKVIKVVDETVLDETVVDKTVLDETVVDKTVDKVSKYKEAFNLELTNIKVQPKTLNSLSGILAITCFLKNDGEEEKEISLHGLWPDIDEKSEGNYNHNEKINLDLNLPEPVIFRENNSSCFSTFSPFFLRHEWNKHGRYANKYNNIKEYLNEACELAKPVLFFLFYMDRIKFCDGEEYDFSKISNDIGGSLFRQYLVKEIDTDKCQELHFRVCANYDETKKKYDWGFCDE